MRQRYGNTFLAVCLMALVQPLGAYAQGVRADETAYVYPKIGFVQYTGDQDRPFFHLWDFDDGGNDGGDGNALPWGAGLEVGYQFNPWSLGLEGAVGFYPTADDGAEDDEWVAYQAKLIGRYTLGFYDWRFAPFGEAGIFLTSAVEDQYDGSGGRKLGFGPLLGLGLDIAVTDRLSLMLELQHLFSFPDDAFDGDERDDRDTANPPPPGSGGEDPCECEVPVRSSASGLFESLDLLNFLGIGLKYSFKPAVMPPNVAGLDCPDYLMAGDVATFTADVEIGADEPLEYRWRFGNNGAIGTGLTTTYTFDEPGTYTVFFTVANEGGEDAEICMVDVARRPIPPEIVTLTANPSRLTVCEPAAVTFNASVLGDEPLTYQWDFGDGAAGTGPSPTHTYTEPGTYTATLTLTGPTGAVATSTTVVEVEECDELRCEDISALNTVYFPLNSSVLSLEEQAALRENLDVLRQIPDLCARIEGWASPSEQQAQELADARARAVAEFFENSGIDASRFVISGNVLPADSTRKEVDAQERRADVIPICCEDLDRE